MGRINLIRPDGTTVHVENAEAAQRLEKLGYRREESSEQNLRTGATATAERFDNPLDKATTTIEGIGSGLTLGLTDVVEGQVLSEEDMDLSRLSAKYNPNYRLGGEIVGAVGGALFTGGLTPAGALAQGSTAIAKGVGGVRGAALAAGIEGAAVGAGQAVSRAELTNEPLAVEQVLAGAGWGAVYGAGLGAALGTAGKIADRYAVRHGADASKFVNPVSEEEFFKLSRTIDDFTGTTPVVAERVSAARGSVKALNDEVARIESEVAQLDDLFSKSGASASKEFDSAFNSLNKEREALGRSVDKELRSTLLNEFDDGPRLLRQYEASPVKERWLREFAEAHPDIPLSQNIKRATSIEDTIFDLRDQHLRRLADTEAQTIAKKELLEAELSPIRTQLSQAERSVEEYMIKSEALKELRRFPTSADEFIVMKKERAERVFGALDALYKSADDGFHPLRQSLDQLAESMSAKAGLSIQTSNPVEKLRKIYNVGRESAFKETLNEIQQAVKAGKTAKDAKAGSFLGRVTRMASARTASSAARKAGAGNVGSAAAYQGASAMAAYATGGLTGLVAEVSGIRSAVANRLTRAVSSLSPTKNKATRTILPRIEPLSFSLDGQVEKDTKDRQELAKRRSREIANAAGNVPNTTYNAVKPFIGEHTNFALALQQQAVQKFNTLLELIPRDPGTAVNQLNSMWKPNPIQVEQFSRVMQVFQFPIQVIEEWSNDLSTIDSIRADAMHKLWPEIMNDFRFQIVQKLPEMGQLDYNNQARLSLLTKIDLHSSFSSQSVAARQNQFMEIPEETSSMGSSSPNPGGRPAKTEPPTPAQSLT